MVAASGHSPHSLTHSQVLSFTHDFSNSNLNMFSFPPWIYNKIMLISIHPNESDM